MGKDIRAKVFKSGNSLALRIPREMGLSEGDELVVVPHQDGSFSCWRERDGLDVLMSLYGSMSPGFMSDGRGDIEQEDYDWSKSAPKGRVA